jgi:hypothetical protein
VAAAVRRRGQLAALRRPGGQRVGLNMSSLHTALFANCCRLFPGRRPNPTDPARSPTANDSSSRSPSSRTCRSARPTHPAPRSCARPYHLHRVGTSILSAASPP